MEKRLTADLNVVANSNLEIQLLDGDLNIIQKLDDEPNDVGGLTSAELKEKFDESGNIIKKYINETLIPAVLTDDATEEDRKQAEAARVAAEQGRVTAEASRVTAEQGRTSAESIRVQNEQKRVSAENSRVEAEAQRAVAEQARADENTGIVAQATAQANAAAGSAESASASAQTAQSAASSAGIAASTASSAAAAASGFASQAQASAAAAAQNAASVAGINKTAESWAVGGTGTRPGEDTDNAKYWAQQAQTAAGGDFATKVEAQGYVTAHNQSVDAHPDLRAAVAGAVRYDAAQSLTDAQKTKARGNIDAAPDGFGLGGVLADAPENSEGFADANLITATGFYRAVRNVLYGGWNYIIHLNYDSATALQLAAYVSGEVYGVREKRLNVWGDWEHTNPPMELGVEYRTTERYLGKPVYYKIVDCGQIADNKQVEHGIVNIRDCISFQGLRGRMPMPSISNNNLSDPWSSYVADVDRIKITLACGTRAAGDTCHVMLKYTKTTD